VRQVFDVAVEKLVGVQDPGPRMVAAAAVVRDCERGGGFLRF
jgi:hypothetical protein